MENELINSVKERDHAKVFFDINCKATNKYSDNCDSSLLFYVGKRWSDKHPILKIPVAVGDIGQAVLNACRMPKISGQTFELFGSEAYYLEDLHEFVYDIMNKEGLEEDHERQIRHVPIGLLKAYARAWELFWFMGEPPLDRVLIELNHLSEVPTGLPGMQELGIKEQGKMSEIVLDILRPFRPHKQYYETMEEVVLPTPVDVEEYKKSLDKSNLKDEGIVGDLNKTYL